jgi:hypothetical protein
MMARSGSFRKTLAKIPKNRLDTSGTSRYTEWCRQTEAGDGHEQVSSSQDH